MCQVTGSNSQFPWLFLLRCFQDSLAGSWSCRGTEPTLWRGEFSWLSDTVVSPKDPQSICEYLYKSLQMHIGLSVCLSVCLSQNVGMLSSLIFWNLPVQHGDVQTFAMWLFTNLFTPQMAEHVGKCIHRLVQSSASCSALSSRRKRTVGWNGAFGWVGWFLLCFLMKL